MPKECIFRLRETDVLESQGKHDFSSRNIERSSAIKAALNYLAEREGESENDLLSSSGTFGIFCILKALGEAVEENAETVSGYLDRLKEHVSND